MRPSDFGHWAQRTSQVLAPPRVNRASIPWGVMVWPRKQQRSCPACCMWLQESCTSIRRVCRHRLASVGPGSLTWHSRHGSVVLSLCSPLARSWSWQISQDVTFKEHLFPPGGTTTVLSTIHVEPLLTDMQRPHLLQSFEYFYRFLFGILFFHEGRKFLD